MPILFRICTCLCCYSLTVCVWTVVSGVQYCSMITYDIQERSGISIDDVIINCISLLRRPALINFSLNIDNLVLDIF